MITGVQNKSNYDIIGDLHGCADELKSLLLKLGYENSRGFYSHPEGRKAIFLGNFIDRGPKIRKTLHIVKSMCDNHTAEAVMGNHEYNALCFWEINKSKGGYLRKHSIKNIMQHSKTIKQFEKHADEWEMYLLWFMNLPVFIEKENLRIVHACWDQKIIDELKKDLPGNRLTKTFLNRSVVKSYKEYRKIHITLKGYEINLPKHHFITDSDQDKKTEARIKWWVNNAGLTYGEYLMHSPEAIKGDRIPADQLPVYEYYKGDIPVFFGHYLLNEHPKLQTPKVACLDYGVEKGGQLTAYCWDGERDLNPGKFITVSRMVEEMI